MQTPTKNDFKRTSTPRYPIYDSGYLSTPLYLSPINENHLGDVDLLPFSHDGLLFTPIKLDNASPYDINQNLLKIGTPSVIKQLSFEDSGFDSSNSSYKNTETHYEDKNGMYFDLLSKNLPAKQKIELLASRRQRRVDYITSLKRRNCERIISDVLSYLPAEDLARMSCVSKMWRKCIMEDFKANGRRKEYIRSIKGIRENRCPFDQDKRYKRLSFLPRLIMNDVTNCVFKPKIVPAKFCDSKFDSFVKEGKKHSGPLLKCPKCSFAAKRIENDEYLCTSCHYVFCKNCFSPYSNNHKCPMLQIPTLIVGSKQCKKNLRRL